MIESVVSRGTVEDTELVDGLVLDLKASHVAGGVTRVEKAKIGLIQFCISPPKTDVSSVSVCKDVEGQGLILPFFKKCKFGCISLYK